MADSHNVTSGNLPRRVRHRASPFGGLERIDPRLVIGFTGTRHGMTPMQRLAVDLLLVEHDLAELHHGDCVGADLDVHRLAHANQLRTVIHPPTDDRLRARCVGDVVLPEKPYHDRNRDIVDACDVLVATPAENHEQSRGGTWFTVRYARSKGKPVHIIWPNGDTNKGWPS